MVKCAIYVVTYDRGAHWQTGEVKPFHWAIFIPTDTTGEKNEGIVHQLRGAPGGYYYRGTEIVDLEKSRKLKEKLEVGEVDGTKTNEIWDCLKEVKIEKNESSSWNCQDWALDGLDKLRAKGFVWPSHTREVIKHWLREVV